MAEEGNAAPGGAPVREIETKSTRLPLFYGVTGHKDDVEPRVLIDRIEAYCRATGKPPNTECHELCMLLRGQPVKWFQSLKDSGTDVADWTTLKAEFLKDYDYRIQNESAFQLLNLRQKTGERIVDYFARVSYAITDMSRGLLETEQDEDTKAIMKRAMYHVQKNLFISGMRESLKTAVLRAPPATLEDAKEAARKAEFIEGTPNLRTSLPIAAIETNGELTAMLESIMSLEPADTDEEELQEQEIAVINNWRKARGRKPFNRNVFRRRNGPSGPFQGKCHNCDKTGHMARYCKAPRSNRSVRSVDEEDQYDQNKMSSIKNW